MFKTNEEVFALVTQKYHGKVIAQVKRGYIVDMLQSFENGVLSRKYMVSLINSGVALFTEDTLFSDYAQALDAEKKLQKEIDANESVIISSQLDMLFKIKNKELRNKSLKEGLRWLIEHGFIEVVIK